tara:strand:+ start:429 stop:1172 length:744 start_codon:yes stop_codon:yes gene_type:complete
MKNFNLSSENLQRIADDNQWGNYDYLSKLSESHGLKENLNFDAEDLYELKKELGKILTKDKKNFNNVNEFWNKYDGEAASIIYSKLSKIPIKLAISEGFWRFLCCYCHEYIYERMGYTSWSNFRKDHFGKIREDALSRNWWRAYSVDDDKLVRIGSSDLWRSFILRRRFSRCKHLNRACIRFFNSPENFTWIFNGEKINNTAAVRELGKEITKRHSITPYEILDEKDCFNIISELASEINLEKKLGN